jgi:hypothetical protein
MLKTLSRPKPTVHKDNSQSFCQTQEYEGPDTVEEMVPPKWKRRLQTAYVPALQEHWPFPEILLPKIGRKNANMAMVYLMSTLKEGTM